MYQKILQKYVPQLMSDISSSYVTLHVCKPTMDLKQVVIHSAPTFKVEVRATLFYIQFDMVHVTCLIFIHLTSFQEKFRYTGGGLSDNLFACDTDADTCPPYVTVSSQMARLRHLIRFKRRVTVVYKSLIHVVSLYTFI